MERQAPLVADGVAVVAIGLAGLSAVIAFLPAEGFVATPLHQALVALLGRSAFVLPTLLLLLGVVRLAHVPVPRARFVGVTLLLLAVLAAEHLLVAGDAGLVGHWLSTTMLDAVGGVGTAVVLLAAFGTGTVLTFGVRLGWR